MHLLLVNRHKQIRLSQVPQDLRSSRLEVWNHHARIANRVIQVSIACVVDADALGASLIWKDFDDGVLALVLGHERPIFEEIKH